MSENSSTPVEKTPLPESVTAEAALPVVESPAISPAAESDALPVAAECAAEAAPQTTSTARFRTAAAEHIAAAHERLALRRKVPTLVVVAALAGFIGAMGTALATAGIAYLAAPADRSEAHARALEDSITRIEAELAALRGNVERTAKLSSSQSSKTSDRLDRTEAAPAEPAANLGKLAGSVEKLSAANAAVQAAAAPVQQATASSDVTGSIKPAPTPAAKSRPASSAIVAGWTLIEVDRDAALIEGKRGLFEIVVGDTIPGVGRVDGFRKQDGRWVVVTPKGLIVSH